MNNISNGSLVKWSSTDENGYFSHYGEVVEKNDNFITMKGDFGVFKIPTTDGEFEVVDSIPKSTKSQQQLGVKKVKTVLVKTSKKKDNTKSEKALELYKQNSSMTRKELICLFVQELGMSMAGASTYVYNCKKICENEN